MMLECSDNVLRVLTIVWNFQKMSGTSEKYSIHMRILWDLRELVETSEDCLRVLRTVKDFQEVFETSEKYSRLPRTAWEFRV